MLRSKSFHANWKIECVLEWAGRFLKRLEEGDLLAQPARRFFGISKQNANIGKVSRGWPSIMILASLEEDVFVIHPRRTILSEITSLVMTRCGLEVEAFQFFFFFFSFFLLGTGKTDGNWLLVEKMRQEIDSRPMRGTTLVFNDFWSLLTLKQGSWLWYIQDKRKSFSFPMERAFVFSARWKMPFL